MPTLRSALALLLVAMGAGGTHAVPDDVPGPEGLLPDAGGWDLVSPDGVSGGRSDAYRAASEYSRRHGGLALVVVKDNTILFEEAENGFELDRAHHLWSGTKTFTCALALAAEADGKLGLEATLGETLGSLLPGGPSDRRASLTVRDLLSLTSGLWESGAILTTDMLRAHPQVLDKEAWTLREIPAVYRPGERFRYAASPFVMFSLMARKALGEDPVDYLARRVLTPIGLRQAGWLRDGAGHAWWSFGAYTTARGWARFGMLLRDDGAFRGQRILPAGAVAKCFQGSAAMPAYGLGIWLNRPAKELLLPPVLHGRFASQGPILLPGGPTDLVAAVGYADNRLYIIPSRGLVIVRYGKGHPGFEDAALLSRLL